MWLVLPVLSATLIVTGLYLEDIEEACERAFKVHSFSMLKENNPGSM